MQIIYIQGYSFEQQKKKGNLNVQQYRCPSVSAGDWFQDSIGYKKTQMLKSLM